VKFNFLKEFTLDAKEQFEKIEQSVINLEKGSTKDDIDTLFRAFHTLKGNSSVAGFPDIRDISHAVEGIISDVRNSVIPMSPEITDVALTSVDAIKQLLKGGAAKNKRVDTAQMLARIAKSRRDLKAAGNNAPLRKLIIKTTDDLAILEIPEFFNKSYIPDMLESLISLRKRGTTRYVFNFRVSRHVSSSGISELAAAKKRMETLGAKAASCEMSPVVEKVFKAVGKSDEMNIKKTLKEAVGSI